MTGDMRTYVMHFINVENQMAASTTRLNIFNPEDRLASNFSLILYPLTSVCIFSILFSIHFLKRCQGVFVKKPRASLVGDHFLDSSNLNV